MALKFQNQDGSQTEYKYLLEIINERTIKPVSSWFSDTPLKHAYEFKLSRLSQLEFNKYQKDYARLGKPKRYYWTVYYFLKNIPEKGNTINLDMELKFSDSEDYFYLLKNAPVEINDTDSTPTKEKQTK